MRSMEHWAGPQALVRPSDAIEHSQPKRSKSKGGDCSAPGCKNRTRENKPYCSAHVACMEYVSGVVERVERFEAELARAQRGGSVRANGLLAQDILGLVEARGVLYTVHIANEYKLDMDAVTRVFRALAKAKRVRLVREGDYYVAFPRQAS